MERGKRIWAAGIIDGEGNIRVEYSYKKNKYIRGTVNVTNTDIRILQELKTYFGGTIYEQRRRNRPNVKRCWNWRIQGPSTIVFLKMVYPYLISKKEQAETVISFYK